MAVGMITNAGLQDLAARFSPDGDLSELRLFTSVSNAGRTVTPSSFVEAAFSGYARGVWGVTQTVMSGTGEATAENELQTFTRASSGTGVAIAGWYAVRTSAATGTEIVQAWDYLRDAQDNPVTATLLNQGDTLSITPTVVIFDDGPR